MATGAEFISKRDRTDEIWNKPGAKVETDIRSGAPMLQKGENPYAVMGVKMELLRTSLRTILKDQYSNADELAKGIEKAVAKMTPAEVEMIPRLEGNEGKNAIKDLSIKLAEAVLPELPTSAIEELKEEIAQQLDDAA